MGLCPTCGYCRSLAEKSASPDAPAPSRTNLGPLGRVFGVLPPWVWLVLVPVAAVLPVCLAADHELPAGSPQRPLWGVAQLGLGLLALFAGQTWALLILRRLREDVVPLDVLSPLKLWSRALPWLPTTSGALALSSGGLTAVLATLLWVNDFSAWLAQEPPSKNDPRTAQATQAENERKQTSEKAAERLALWELAAQRRQQQKKEQSQPTVLGFSLPVDGTGKQAPATRPVARCVVTGYILSRNGRIARLVLATHRDGKLTDAGVISPALGARRQARLLARLAILRRADPVLEGPTRVAVWVNPVVFCEVWHSGVDNGGLLIEPVLKAIVEE
jgi:hypothetical protein